MSIFPGAIPPAGAAIPTDSLAVAGHTALHNAHSNEIRELATKTGTGSSVPAAGTVLRGTGAGTSSWAQTVLSTDVTGILPEANGGTGQSSLANLPLPSPAISGAVSGGATYASPILTTPTIADYSNATHTHASNAQGGLLNGANAITDGTITPAELMAGAGSSWVWQSYTPTILADGGSPTNGNAVIDCAYVQIGKTVHGRFSLVLGTTTNFGSGTVYWSLPVTPRVITKQGAMIGVVYIEDLATVGYTGWIQMDAPTSMHFVVHSTAGNGRVANVSGSVPVPFTFGTGDYFTGTFMYEAA